MLAWFPALVFVWRMSVDDATVRLSCSRVALQPQLFCQRCLFPECSKHFSGKDGQRKLITINTLWIFMLLLFSSVWVWFKLRDREVIVCYRWRSSWNYLRFVLFNLFITLWTGRKRVFLSRCKAGTQKIWQKVIIKLRKLSCLRHGQDCKIFIKCIPPTRKISNIQLFSLLRS